MRPAVLSKEELERLLSAELPAMVNPHSGVSILEVRHGFCRVRQAFKPSSLRPGGTISGPTMMALADFAMYVGVLASIGPVPLAVTTNLNINFLRKPGKRLAVGDVTISSDGVEEPVAHVTATYSIPAK